MTVVLGMQGVTRRYGDAVALDGVDLEVRAGAVLALLGPNGAGKSTLVSLASGLAVPDAGQVRVAGRDPASRRSADRRLVGVAPQDIAIYPVLSVRDNLRAFGEMSGLGEARARGRVDELAEPFRLTGLLDRRAGQLSGGEQRRLHTAAAVVHRPALVLLDEPTAGADVQTRAAILDVVRSLAQDGAAVVYTTHYLPEAEELAADVAILCRGRIVARGTLDELVAHHAEAAVLLDFDGPVPELTWPTGTVVDGDGAVQSAGGRARVPCDDPGAALPGLLAPLGEHAAQLRSVTLVRPCLEAVYLALTDDGVPPTEGLITSGDGVTRTSGGAGHVVMSPTRAVLRNELRILGRDPLPGVILVAMPVILMALLTPALRLTLEAEGYDNASGAEQSVPGMLCIFASFAVALVGFSFFREHGWRTWSRVRVAGAAPRHLLLGKLAVPALELVAQHVLLFAFGVVVLDLEVRGSWLAVALVAVAFGALVLVAGLVVAATVRTIQQMNAVTNLAAMVLGGLGGGFVPVDTLPGWVRPLAPVSPVYWAMRGYHQAMLDGGGLADMAGPLTVLLAVTIVLALLALRLLRLDTPKLTWG